MEEWKEATIGEAFELYSGNTPSRLDKDNFVGDVIWITSGELKEHYIGDTKEHISKSSVCDNHLRLLPVGTFVIAIYGLEADGIRGTGSITTKESTISQACMAFTPKMDISNEFLFSWYKKHGNIIGLKYAQGTKQQNISNDILEKFKIIYPDKNEQEKLTRFIELIDQRITAQIGAINKHESLIKAIAGELTCEGEKVRLADLVDCHSSTMQENDITNDGPYPVYGATGICGYTDSPMCKEDAIIIVKDGSGVGNIKFVSGGFSILGTLCYITAKQDVSIGYVYCCLVNFDFSPYKTGMAIPHIYFKDYGKGKINIKNVAEQQKTRTLVLSLMNKLDVERQLLKQYKLQKQYLLSQMFV